MSVEEKSEIVLLVFETACPRSRTIQNPISRGFAMTWLCAHSNPTTFPNDGVLDNLRTVLHKVERIIDVTSNAVDALAQVGGLLITYQQASNTTLCLDPPIR